MEIKKLLIFVIFTIFLASIVSSQPPFQQSLTDNGLTLETSYPTTHKQNTDLYVHIHAYNSSTGLLMPTSLISCTAHAYSHNIGGEHISNFSLTSYGVGFNGSISAENFKDNGDYSVLIWCNNSAIGGFFQYTFEVNPQGIEYNVPYSIIFVALLTLSLVIFGLSLYGFIVLPYENNRNAIGFIESINYLKYLKMFSFAMMYVLFIAITYFAWSVSYGILRFTEMANVFYWLFRLSYVGALVILPLIFVLGGIKFLLDLQLDKKLDRRLNIK